MKMTNISEAKTQHSNLEMAGIASMAQWSSCRTPEANQAEYPQSAKSESWATLANRVLPWLRLIEEIGLLDGVVVFLMKHRRSCT